jgi:PAT family beta-lactamase induction signal transducer AmpG
MAATPILADSTRVRYATGSMMYFAQGIPQGLLGIAIPAWLASEGVGAGDIATYLAVIVLPWAFKLLAGPFMDRFEYPPMGRRRPWVIVAQLGLSVSLLSLMLVEQPAEQMGLLMIVGALVNSFAATQDVAVDGMAIDMTPVREQGRLNAFMSFGKAVGWAATAAVSGWLLVTFGMKVTASIAGAVAALVLLMFIPIREREGERMLPWTAGEAVPRQRTGESFRAVFGGINQVLWSRTSVMVMAVMGFDGVVSGYGQALMPVAAVQVFGYTTPQWSQLVATMGLIGAGIALGLGPLIDRFGAKRMLLLTISLVGIHAFLIAQTQYLWEDTTYIRVMLSIWVLMLPVVMVCVIALAMAICGSSHSATQFAIYMSVANLGHSAGSKLFGLVVERSTYGDIYMLLGGLVVAMVVVLVFHRHRHEAVEVPARRAARTYTIGAAGGEAGIFWSGAMRCPKCRSDMEQIVVGETEVDRCTSCRGIWFDAGEMQALGNKDAAEAIDIGSAAEGRRLNVVDKYRCPRCGGRMESRTDPKQRHIRYETCVDCEGAFFDAGEFRDISQLTVMDFFRGLVARKRS